MAGGTLKPTINQFTGVNFNIWKVFFSANHIEIGSIQRSPDTEHVSWNPQ